MDAFFENPWKYYNNDSKWGKWLAKNVNFFDLGYDNEITDKGLGFIMYTPCPFFASFFCLSAFFLRICCMNFEIEHAKK